MLPLLLPLAAAQCDFYVSLTGSDTSDGTTRTTAFATVGRALRSTRAFHLKAPQARCAVTLLGGVHSLAAPIVLNQSDSFTSFYGDGSASVLSGGTLLDPACWQPLAGSPQLQACTLPPAVLSALGTRELKVLSIGNRISTPARFPKPDPSRPASSGWLTLNSSTFLGNSTFEIGVTTASLPSFARVEGFRGNVHIWPCSSWIDIHGVTVALLPDEAPPSAERNLTEGEAENEPPLLTRFLLRCPDQLKCTNTSNTNSILKGNRFFLYGERAAMTAPGDWTYDSSLKRLLLYTGDASAADKEVRVPTVEVLVWVRGEAGAPVTNVSFEGLGFADSRHATQQRPNPGPASTSNPLLIPRSSPRGGQLRRARRPGWLQHG